MGESTCFVQSNSLGNYVHDLGDSVSFGRFTSESLVWDKWSNFPHKRYVEEAKSYAQPGSVAEKKAFFEAHYKKVAAQKAAAAAAAELLEQEKVKVQIEEEVCGTNHGARESEPTVSLKSHNVPTGIPKLPDLKTTKLQTKKVQQTGLNLKMFINEKQKIILRDSSKAVDVAGHSSGVNLIEPQTVKIVESANLKNKEITNNLEEDQPSVSEDSRSSQMDRPLLKSKSNTDQEVMQPKIRRKPATPYFRSPSINKKQSRIPPSPTKYVASMHPRKENMFTPKTNNNTSMDTIDNKRTAPKSLYTLMNSGSVKESCKPKSPAVRKADNAKRASSAYSTPKRSATPSITPSKRVTNDANKQQLATPSVIRRMETPVHPSAVESKTPGQKWHLFSAVSKSLSAYKSKLQSPTVSTPFTLRTEERAARRKQKLEEKFNEKEAQKVQLQTTLKEKAETEFRRLRQSFCFKARPLPSFYNETPKSPLKKTTPQATQKSLTPARKQPPPSTISQPSSTRKSSRRLWQTNNQNPATHPLAELARRINHENISPNVQH
ncbi:uncharacterized protein [Rutidosis leptorrhynchoides]|uniref:uncharacterized protein n=1 Tax=Rutidosis leptorrhynchoides TaxID=125765 RepID=UPI003A99672C